MKINCGKYIINTSSYNMWIEENKTAKDSGKEYSVRVTGYHNNTEALKRDFLQVLLFGADTESLESAFEKLKELETELERIASVVRLEIGLDESVVD